MSLLEENRNPSPDRRQKVALIVPRPLTKLVKSALESKGILDRESKIAVLEEEKEDDAKEKETRGVGEKAEQRMLIPTMITTSELLEEDNEAFLVPRKGGGGNVNTKDYAEQAISTSSNSNQDQEGATQVHDKRDPSWDAEQLKYLKERLLRFLALNVTPTQCQQIDIHINISKIALHSLAKSDPYSKSKQNHNPLTASLLQALRTHLPSSLLAGLESMPEVLAHAFPTTYSIYKPMLLLPAHAFASTAWKKAMEKLDIKDSEAFQKVWEMVAREMKVKCIAVNSGIPVSKSSSTSPEDKKEEQTQQREQQEENILRAPLRLTPLYGPFGPSPTPTLQSAPTPRDFHEALWVETVQNGIVQVWAPLYTMFSRGNIREKSRILELESVKSCTQHPSTEKGEKRGGRNHRDGATALDLYSGIGYFTFCYRRAGIRKLLCWELNPWSVEGLRRGAERNGWKCAVIHPPPDSTAFSSPSDSASPDWRDWATNGALDGKEVHEADFVVFRDSNENALSVVNHPAWSGADPKIPPIRHVNCGFLPSSCLSWKTAVRALDLELGGWIHAHENVGAGDIETRKGEVETLMQGYLDEWDAERGSCGGYRRRVVCEHVERVKTYAPGVVHVVFDVRVDGRNTAVQI